MIATSCLYRIEYILAIYWTRMEQHEGSKEQKCAEKARRRYKEIDWGWKGENSFFRYLFYLYTRYFFSLNNILSEKEES